MSPSTANRVGKQVWARCVISCNCTPFAGLRSLTLVQLQHISPQIAGDGHRPRMHITFLGKFHTIPRATLLWPDSRAWTALAAAVCSGFRQGQPAFLALAVDFSAISARFERGVSAPAAMFEVGTGRVSPLGQGLFWAVSTLEWTASAVTSALQVEQFQKRPRRPQRECQNLQKVAPLRIASARDP